MRISRLYFKLYLYFVGVILILIILLPLVLFHTGKPPHVRFAERMFFILEGIDYSIDRAELEKKLNEASEKFKCHIALYDNSGKSVFSSGKDMKNLTEKEMENAEKKGFQVIDEGRQKDIFIISLKKKKVPYSYLTVKFEFFEERNHLKPLLFIGIFLLLLVYPLAIYITKPLEKITQKAIKFAGGDFSEIDKKIDIKGGDEISRLNEAFSHMANELVAMIEGKKELISDISHELGSPLSRMQVAVDIMEGKIEKGETPPLKTVKKLSKNISEMSKLTKELLEYSRMNKAYILNIEVANLEEIIDEIIQKFQVITEQNKISVNLTKEGDIKKVFIDKVKIARVIQNLLLNSLDYSPPEGIIEIIVKGEDGHFSVTVKDEGPGISEKNQEKIFEPFFREDPSRTRKTGGTGLGLAIVHKIIKLHGGKIWVENPGAKGAEITFKI